MGVEAEADVGIALPILAIVARLMKRRREVRDLILRKSVSRQPRAGYLVELCRGFIGGNAIGVEALTAGHDLASEA